MSSYKSVSRLTDSSGSSDAYSKESKAAAAPDKGPDRDHVAEEEASLAL